MSASVVRERDSWIETANVDNALATATRAAPEGGIRHFITSVSGSYGGTLTEGELVLKQGTTEIGRWQVHDDFAVAFASPIGIEAGNAVSLELAASGTASNFGAVNLTGYTL